jgi:cell division protein FtsB
MKTRLVKKGTAWFLRIAAFLLLILVSFLSYALFEESYKKSQVKKEIERLRLEAEAIENKNFQIREKIAYLESREFLEKEAKDKLNLQREGENLIVIKPGPLREKSSEEEDFSQKEGGSSGIQKTNCEKWWDYFFKY